MKLAQRYHGWPTCAVLQPPRQYHAAEHQAHTRRACRHEPACEVQRVRRTLVGGRAAQPSLLLLACRPRASSSWSLFHNPCALPGQRSKRAVGGAPRPRAAGSGLLWLRLPAGHLCVCRVGRVLQAGRAARPSEAPGRKRRSDRDGVHGVGAAAAAGGQRAAARVRLPAGRPRLPPGRVRGAARSVAAQAGAGARPPPLPPALRKQAPIAPVLRPPALRKQAHAPQSTTALPCASRHEAPPLLAASTPLSCPALHKPVQAAYPHQAVAVRPVLRLPGCHRPPRCPC